MAGGPGRDRQAQPTGATRPKLRGRWLHRLEGTRKDAAGQFDLEIILAERFGWPKTLIDRQDPEYMDELVAYLNAYGDHEDIKKKRSEAEQRRKERELEAKRGR